MDSVRLRVGGSPVLVHSNDDAFLAVVRRSFVDLVWPISTLWDDSDTAGVIRFDVLRNDLPWTDWGIWRDGEPCEITLTQDYVIFQLQWELNRVVLERQTLTVHAAAAEIDGCGLMFPGASTSGKTTLAGWIGLQGGAFVADEVVAVRGADRSMIPYHRPLGLRPGGPLESGFIDAMSFETAFDGYEKLAPMSALGGSLSSRPFIAIHAIVFPQYTPGAVVSLKPLPKSDAFQRLCSLSPGLAEHGVAVFSALAGLVRDRPTFELVSDDLGRALDLIRHEIANHWYASP